MIDTEKNIAFLEIKGPDGKMRIPVDNVSVSIEREPFWHSPGPPDGYDEKEKTYSFRIDEPVRGIYYEIHSQ